ncbi:alpha/beta fold hydrolase [Dyella caseinilytica]|uniref:Alpha/beta hydrolase n=1 Tax=Dyella caseinilytica TaxID=1849581 RepID=A0ABX7GP41_9GAMM|nr:alpha/beta hydrolase [Dyella caseinilytica]QRN52148.1 alpha/beta hydrolase [Dyella caseinilytica]GGA13704.1 alpha/beta hydrolase [Dyella caseinilytica]
MTTSTTHWIDVDHARLYAEEAGEAGEGDAITMLHGFLVDSGQWDTEFVSLAKTHRVLRYDARGFGRSTIESGRYAHHKDLATVLDARGIRRTALLACSGGAATALDFTLAHPERVSALILVGAGYWGRFADSTPAARAFLQALSTMDANGLIDSSLRAFTDGPCRAPNEVDPAVRKHTEAMTTRLFKRETSYWTRAAQDQQVPQPSALERLHEIDVPVVLIVGSEDQMEVRHLTQELARGMAHARALVMDGAGHHANMEAPAQVLAEIRNVLRLKTQSAA